MRKTSSREPLKHRRMLTKEELLVSQDMRLYAKNVKRLFRVGGLSVWSAVIIIYARVVMIRILINIL